MNIVNPNIKNNKVIYFHEGENLKLDCRILYPSNPLILNPELAEAMGIEEAIVVQQIKYWLNENARNNKKDTHFHEGKWWTYNSLQAWQETNFRFIPLTSLRKVFKRLIDLKILVTGIFNNDPRDRTLWYTIDYLQLNAFLTNAFDPTGQMEDYNNLDDDLNISLTNEKRTNAFDPTGQMQMTPQVKCNITETNLQRKEEGENFLLKKDFRPSDSIIDEIKTQFLCSDEALEEALKEFKDFYIKNKIEKRNWEQIFENWCANRKSWKTKETKPIIREETDEDILAKYQGETREIMSKLLQEFGNPVFKSWLMHLKLIDSNNDCVRFKVPTNFIKEWIEKNYLEDIKAVVNALKPSLKREVVLC